MLYFFNFREVTTKQKGTLNNQELKQVKINNNEFIITSLSEENTIMSFTLKLYPLTGIQYHPESVLTPYGKEILKNWIRD